MTADTAYTLSNVTAAHTIAAAFSANSYTLTVGTVGAGTVGRSPDQATYAYGSAVQLTALPAGGRRSPTGSSMRASRWSSWPRRTSGAPGSMDSPG